MLVAGRNTTGSPCPWSWPAARRYGRRSHGPSKCPACRSQPTGTPATIGCHPADGRRSAPVATERNRSEYQSALSAPSAQPGASGTCQLLESCGRGELHCLDNSWSSADEVVVSSDESPESPTSTVDSVAGTGRGVRVAASSRAAVACEGETSPVRRLSGLTDVGGCGSIIGGTRTGTVGRCHGSRGSGGMSGGGWGIVIGGGGGAPTTTKSGSLADS